MSRASTVAATSWEKLTSSAPPTCISCQVLITPPLLS